MRVAFYQGCRLALALAVFPTAARAQTGEPAAGAPPPPSMVEEMAKPSHEEEKGNITALVPWLMQQLHYTHHRFDTEMAGKFLDRYLDSLDHWHLYFLQSDLNHFEAYRDTLPELSMRGYDYSPSTVMFSRFMERAAQRTEYLAYLLHREDFEFTNQERFIANRHTLPNPANLEEAHRLWRQELRVEYLDEKLKEPDMAVSGAASFDAESNVLIVLPLEYTNSVSGNAKAATASRTGETVRPGQSPEGLGFAETTEHRFESPVPLSSLLPGQFLDQDHHAFGSIIPTASNVIVRLQIPPQETQRKMTNNFYTSEGKRLGSIRFLHPGDTGAETNKPAPAEAGPASKLKGVVELDRKDPAEIVKTLSKRYTSLLRNYNDLTNDDYVLERYLTALAHAYDPHSDYMAGASAANFNIQMNLSLVGIGAKLTMEDDDCKIDEVVEEGPAAKSGQFAKGDIIKAVAQKDQEPVPTAGMPVFKVVEMIRGPKDTLVTLTIEKAHPADPSVRQKTVTLKRDVIKLEDQAAKARFYETPTTSSGPPTRIGVLDLSSFYADNTAPDKPGEPAVYHGSTTKDTARLIARLQKENVDGLILDLRNNGGGYLDQAIGLTGLFVNGVVPVVQTRGPDEGPNRPGLIEVEGTPARSPVFYDGPLIVLTSRFSASASEIVAGALQDYGRALIVGDKATFGKGTVQQVQSLSNIISRRQLAYDPGSVKVTIKKFYRAGGSSTQSNGVASDIVLPSVLNYVDVGESSLPNPLPWDEVTSADHLPELNRVQPYLAELLKRSQARREMNKDFAYIQEDIDEYRKSLEDKSLSLNEAERLAEQSATAARMEARKKERASRPKLGEKLYEITLKNVDLPELHPPEVKPKPAPSPDDDPDDVPAAASDPVAGDPALTEARRIMADYISLYKQPPAAVAHSVVAP
jgi:carboxyl-terminal processing protease